MDAARDSTGWQRAHHFALDIYRATARFPAAEQGGLADQMRRSAALLPIALAQTNRACMRPRLCYLLSLIDQSIRESQYYIILARDLGYLAPELSRILRRDLDEVERHLKLPQLPDWLGDGTHTDERREPANRQAAVAAGG